MAALAPETSTNTAIKQDILIFSSSSKDGVNRNLFLELTKNYHFMGPVVKTFLRQFFTKK
jgi:hypothetical protein